MDEENEPDTKESIRLAAIDLIERTGGGRVTTRAIAAAANVNVAAINYYYRSKDALLTEALKSSWNHAFRDLEAFLTGDPWDYRKGLEGLTGYLIEGGARFPNITRAQLLGLGSNGESEKDGPSFVAASCREIIALTAAKVGSALGLPVDDRLILRTGSLFASMLYPALLPDAFPPLKDNASLELYKTVLVDDYLVAVTAGYPKR